MISTDGIVIRIPADQISTFARPSKGVRVMRVNEGEHVATISVVDRVEDEDETAETGENGETAQTAAAAPAETTEPAEPVTEE